MLPIGQAHKQSFIDPIFHDVKILRCVCPSSGKGKQKMMGRAVPILAMGSAHQLFNPYFPAHLPITLALTRARSQ
jgi:hypothetical protein